MSEFRTFSGKTVDEALEEACRHFGAARDKLEIEILSGGSSGIFGLVGKKKAEIKAKVREEINLLSEMPGQGRRETAPRAAQPPRAPKPPRQPAAPRPRAEAAVEPETAPGADDEPVSACEPAPRPQQQPCPVPVETGRDFEDEDDAEQPREAFSESEESCADRGNAVAEEETPDDDAPRPRESRTPREERRSAAPETPPQPMTPELEALVREVMEQMLDGILGQIPEFEISGHSERVSVLILDEENSGLLIGREGQTLSSIQYLVNRIVIRRHGSPVKVQINTGEYRERQDDNLRKMAIFLADKAKTLGRPQSTKPLSSYHRRVVHLALQEDEAISTRSKGEGPLKRVLIVPRGGRGEVQNNQHS